MRAIIEYFRSLFCKHDFKYEERRVTLYTNDWFDGPDYVSRKGIKVFQHCPKCGYHKNYWKYM